MKKYSIILCIVIGIFLTSCTKNTNDTTQDTETKTEFLDELESSDTGGGWNSSVQESSR